jgi:hypothetical protein
MAESTRTFLTRNRLKSAIEVMPLRSPRHRRARAGRPGDKIFRRYTQSITTSPMARYSPRGRRVYG